MISFKTALIIFALSLISVNLFLTEKKFDSILDEASFYQNAGKPKLAEKKFLDLLSADSFDIDVHYSYISNHFDIPEQTKVSKHHYEYRDDQTIQEYYKSLIKNTNDSLSDIGIYGTGLIYSFKEENKNALDYFNGVKNKKLKYLNNSIGVIYENMGEISRSEDYYRREIQNKGNLNGAYNNLTDRLYADGKLDEIKQLINDPETSDFIPERIKRIIYLSSNQIFRYYSIVLQSILESVNLWGFLAALLILIVWTLYLRRLDIFEPEKWSYTILAIVLGAVFVLIVHPISDIDNYQLGFRLNGNILNDFYYCVLGIGAVEELSKIIPFLLILYLTPAINEPYDYLKYASLSALGFAFTENLIYFDRYNLDIVHGRALMAAIGHMFDTSIFAYGLVLNKYKKLKWPFLNALLFFFLASFSHGFYDFWLINEKVSVLSIITTFYFVSNIYMWNSFKNNALNHSEFYKNNIDIEDAQIQSFLIGSLALILNFEYLCVAFTQGPSLANKALFSALFNGSFIMFIIAGSLGQFSLLKGKWLPIQFWNDRES